MLNSLIESEMLEIIIKPEYLIKSIIIVCLDLTKPWEIMDQIKKWSMYFYDKFSKFLLKLPVEKQHEMTKSLENYLKLWEEECQLNPDGGKKEKPSEEVINLKLEMPLKEGLLKTNLGIPIIFVVNKSDIVVNANERKRYEEDSEFIFKYIRKYALICKIYFITNILKMAHL